MSISGSAGWSASGRISPIPRSTDRSITEIAFGRGFSSSTHFSRSFRENCGVSPRVYRLLMQGTSLFWHRAARRQWAKGAQLLHAAE